jgi:hypothetical protein
MSKAPPIRLPDKVADAMLQARASITAALDNRLVLQRPDIDRPPRYDRKTDYRVLWRGHVIGRIWMHDYVGERWAGLGPWHWYWEWEHQHRTPTAHAPTLEAAMADFRKVWDSDKAKSQRA